MNRQSSRARLSAIGQSTVDGLVARSGRRVARREAGCLPGSLGDPDVPSSVEPRSRSQAVARPMELTRLRSAADLRIQRCPRCGSRAACSIIIGQVAKASLAPSRRPMPVTRPGGAGSGRWVAFRFSPWPAGANGRQVAGPVCPFAASPGTPPSRPLRCFPWRVHHSG